MTSLLTSGGALVAAKIVFVVAGYAIYASLSRLLTPAQFGTFLVVNSAVAVLNTIFVSGTIQAVSRFVAKRPEAAAGTLRTALWLQLVLAGTLSSVYLLGAPLVAAALNDPELTSYLRLSAVIPLAYAFYAAMIGYANGLRRFGTQAAFDISFSMVKIVLVTGLPWLGYGALGAVAGFSTASIVILVASWLIIGRRALKDQSDGAPVSAILQYAIVVMGHVGVTNLLMQLDLLMVKGLMPGGDANVAAAMYGAAVKLAQIPYSVLVALNFLIFPYIARSTAELRREETAFYVRQAFRMGTSLIVGPAVVLGSVSSNALSLVFGPDYAAAGPVLVLLVSGYVVFSLLTTATTVINGSGRPGISLGVATITVLAQIVAARLLIPIHGIMGAAMASVAAYSCGLILSTAYLLVTFGNVLPWTSLARVAGAGTLVAAIGHFGVARLPVVAAALLLGACYLLALALLREWNSTDLKAAMAGRSFPALDKRAV